MPEFLDRNASVKPGDDFYRYANRNWPARAVISLGQRSFDTRAVLKEKVSGQVLDLIANAAATHPEKGSIVPKVGDY